MQSPISSRGVATGPDTGGGRARLNTAVKKKIARENVASGPSVRGGHCRMELTGTQSQKKAECKIALSGSASGCC